MKKELQPKGLQANQALMRGKSSVQLLFNCNSIVTDFVVNKL